MMQLIPTALCGADSYVSTSGSAPRKLSSRHCQVASVPDDMVMHSSWFEGKHSNLQSIVVLQLIVNVYRLQLHVAHHGPCWRVMLKINTPEQ